jgi:putative effector of murein hydrolase
MHVHHIALIALATISTFGTFTNGFATSAGFKRPKPHTLKAASKVRSSLSTSAVSLKLPAFDSTTRKQSISAASFVLLDIAFRTLFKAANVDFPSSLGGCGFLFATLLALPPKASSFIYDKLTPGAALLAKWLPVFFVPSLITLPLADSIGTSAELIKVVGIVFGGFFFSLLSAAFSVIAVRKAMGNESPVKAELEDLTSKATQNVMNAVPSKPFSDECFHALTLTSVGLGLLTLASRFAGTTVLARQSSALFLLATTLSTFVYGARLPKKLTKIIHPLLICTSFTWAVARALAAATGQSFRSILKSYRTGSLGWKTSGAGDILLFLLGPAVISLAISMYEKRKLMRDNLAEVGTAVGVSTFGGLYGTALLVRLLDIGNPFLRLSLLSRNITSPLAMAIAAIIGADVSLAVSAVVLTGVFGANFGATILTALGIKDPVARGLGIGASAHGLGTAAFANEKDAFPFAAIAMALTASAATVVVSIPFFRRILLQLALGV